MTINTIGIDPSASINSIEREVPRIFDPGIMDFFSNGYSIPRCIIDVIRMTRL